MTSSDQIIVVPPLRFALPPESLASGAMLPARAGNPPRWRSGPGEECFEVWTSSTTPRLQPTGSALPCEGALSRLMP